MGRRAVAEHVRRKPYAFGLNARELTLLEAWAEHKEVNRSEALRDLLHLAEEHLPGELRADLAIRRRDLRRESIVAPEPTPAPKCPNCGDTDLFIQFPDGRWRCDMCIASG